MVLVATQGQGLVDRVQQATTASFARNSASRTPDLLNASAIASARTVARAALVQLATCAIAQLAGLAHCATSRAPLAVTALIVCEFATATGRLATPSQDNVWQTRLIPLRTTLRTATMQLLVMLHAVNLVTTARTAL